MSLTVSGVFTYPIKSCAGLSHSAMALDERGLRWDRRWMVVDPEGMFYTQREQHRLALVQPRLSATHLHLTAPNMPEISLALARTEGNIQQVTVWKDTCAAWDEGAALADWFSAYLNAPARLVRMTDAHFRQVDIRYAPYRAQTGFADGFPLLIATEASLADLNRRLGERGASPVPMNRFRPNLVVAGASAFEEDTWTGVVINGVRLDVVKPCARCVMVTVDQATGEADKREPTATLATFRKQGEKVMFGQNAVHRGLGTLSVGDVVWVE